MGLFNKMKNFFWGFKYKLDREILREYLQHTINFAVENKLPFGDELYINAEDFISQELCTLPEEFFVFMDMAPTMLEQYEI